MQDLLPGDVILFARDGPTDRLIRWAQARRASLAPWCRFTHCAVCVAPGSLVEAVVPRVRRRLITLADRPVTIVHLELTDAQRAAIASAAQGYVGTEYGIADVLNFGFMLVFGRQLPFKDNDSLWCSQLVASALQAGGILTDVDPGQCSPASLAARLGVLAA